MKDLLLSAPTQEISPNASSALKSVKCGFGKDCGTSESASPGREPFSKALSRETAPKTDSKPLKSSDKNGAESKAQESDAKPSSDAKDSAEPKNAVDQQEASKPAEKSASADGSEAEAESAALVTVLSTIPVEKAPEAKTDIKETVAATLPAEVAAQGKDLPQDGILLPADAAKEAPIGIQIREAVKEILQAAEKKIDKVVIGRDALAAAKIATKESAPTVSVQAAGIAAQLPEEVAKSIQALGESESYGLLQAAANQNAQVGQQGDVHQAVASPGQILSTQQTETIKSAMANTAPNQIQTPVQHPNWGNELGNRMIWMVNNDVKGAEIKLNPAHLGPMEIRISVTNDQANLSITAAHGTTREAVEASISKLRDMLGQEGLNLANVDVSQHSFKEQREQFAQSLRNRSNSDDEESNSVQAAEMFAARGKIVKIGVIDFFA